MRDSAKTLDELRDRLIGIGDKINAIGNRPRLPSLPLGNFQPAGPTPSDPPAAATRALTAVRSACPSSRLPSIPDALTTRTPSVPDDAPTTGLAPMPTLSLPATPSRPSASPRSPSAPADRRTPERQRVPTIPTQAPTVGGATTVDDGPGSSGAGLLEKAGQRGGGDGGRVIALLERIAKASEGDRKQTASSQPSATSMPRSGRSWTTVFDANEAGQRRGGEASPSVSVGNLQPGAGGYGNKPRLLPPPKKVGP